MAVEIMEVNKARTDERSDAASEKVAMTSANPAQTDDLSLPGGGFRVRASLLACMLLVLPLQNAACRSHN
jgi:hypothetical protein